ncbi:MAG TPA: hypothetical protein VJ596_12290 [Gemmatimonadaceae bacterium]|nr:hypothetical protein [Gemmatimonadaceae bacterium]
MPAVSPVIVRSKQLRNALGIAEPLAGRAPGIVGREALPLELSGAHLEVQPKLVVNIGIDIGPPEAEVAPPGRRPAH